MFFIAQRWTGKLAHKRWLVLGALTYPLYLIHQNIGYMLFDQLYLSINPHLLFWGTLGLMLILAYGIYAVFEKCLTRQIRQILEQVLKVKPTTHMPSSLSSSR